MHARNGDVAEEEKLVLSQEQQIELYRSTCSSAAVWQIHLSAKQFPHRPHYFFPNTNIPQGNMREVW